MSSINNNTNKAFDRTMDEEIYQAYKPYIKLLVNKVKKINQGIDKKIPVLFYKKAHNNYIRLYIKGMSLKIRFKDISNKSFDIDYSDKIVVISAEKFKKETSIVEFDNFIAQLPDLVKAFLDYKNNNQKERELEGDLVAALQDGKHSFAAIDMEIVVSNSSAINCLEGSLSNPEMDILLITELNNKFYLIPVELKRAEASSNTKKRAPAEIASCVNLLSDELMGKAMIETYVNNCKKYRELGLLSLDIQQPIVYGKLCSGLIVIIDEKKGKLYTVDTVNLKDKKSSNLIKDAVCPQEYEIKRLTMSSEIFIDGKWIKDV